MASDNDEDDYMSAMFLEEPEDLKNKELSYVEKRKKTLREQQKKAYIKPRRVLEEEARQEGLQKELDEKNKGMKMLMKMGFKQGMTLGKMSGLAKPIDVEVKSGRGGIGLDTQEKRLREEELEQELAKKPKIDPYEYREQLSARKREGQLQRWIIAAAKICEKLDKDQGIEFNILWLLNPINFPKEEGEEVDVIETSDVAHVEDSAVDNPHADTETAVTDQHVQALKLSDDDKILLAELQALSLADQLEKLVQYLRTKYFYCFWCGAKYEDEEDLKNCPGPTEDDH